MISSKRIAISEDEKDSIGLLTSLLVRFPEICSINYYPSENSLKLIFILHGKPKEYILNKFSDELSTCIRTYLRFEKSEGPKSLQQFLINFEYELNYTKIIITRDIDSLLPKEISIAIYLLNTYFKNLLIIDESSVFIEEDLLLQDDYIKCLLDSLQAKKLENEIIALREEGRVLVFKQ